MITRRHLLKSGAVAGLLAGQGPVFRAFASSSETMESTMEDRIAKIIAAYDAQGIHRTGTVGDRASAQWLAGQFADLGIDASLDVLEFERLDVQAATLAVGGMTISGVPLYDCTYTGPEGIKGTLGPIGSDADIGVVMLPPFGGTPGFRAMMQARKSGSHRALILVTDTQMPAGGVATINAEAFAEPYGPPALQIPNDQWPLLQQAMQARTPAQVVLHANYVPGVAENVQAKVAGTDSDLAPLVVMTPRSGWWRCASERGGGMATLIEIARVVSAARPKRTVIFTANTGHELGHTGLDHYLHANPELIGAAHMWIHLGANYAAKVGNAVRLQFSDEVARQSVHALTVTGPHAATETPMGERPLGEARNIFDGNGRYISILGGNGLFHHPADTWPEAVDVELTTRWTKVMVEATVNLANQAG